MGIEAKFAGVVVSTKALAVDLRFYARRRWPTANDKFRKARLVELLGFTARRVKSLYEGEETAVLKQHEAAKIEVLIGKKLTAAEELEEAQHEYRTLAEIEASLQSLSYGPHADFYRAFLDAFSALAFPQGSHAEARGRADRARDQGRDRDR